METAVLLDGAVRGVMTELLADRAPELALEGVERSAYRAVLCESEGLVTP